jgi:hypothetical protein
MRNSGKSHTQANSGAFAILNVERDVMSHQINETTIRKQITASQLENGGFVFARLLKGV